MLVFWNSTNESLNQSSILTKLFTNSKDLNDECFLGLQDVEHILLDWILNPPPPPSVYPIQLFEQSTEVGYGPVTVQFCSGTKTKFSPTGTSVQVTDGVPNPGLGLQVTQYHSVKLGPFKIVTA